MLEMALSFVDPTDPAKFQYMRVRVHLDEKWFFLTKKKERYLLLPEEDKQLLVGWQVGNLAYRPVGSSATRFGQQAKGNLGLEEPDSDSTSLLRPTNH